MDKLAERLRDDAAAIDATIAPELDARIRASLEGATPEAGTQRARAARRPLFWWASSLTGAAAAAALILAVNLQSPAPESGPVQDPLKLPILRGVEWHAEAAVLTRPLEQEMDDLQSDLKKAERVVKGDIDRLF